MADLRNRIDMEGSAAARLERLQVTHRQALMAHLGPEIDASSVPDSFWATVEADRLAQLKLIGLIVYTVQARDHGATNARAQQQAGPVVDSLSSQVARDTTAHNRSLLARHAPTGENRLPQPDTLRFGLSLQVFPPAWSEATARLYVAQIAGRAAEDTARKLPIVVFTLGLGVSGLFLARLLARSLRSSRLATALQLAWMAKTNSGWQIRLPLDQIARSDAEIAPSLSEAQDAIQRELADILRETTADDQALARRLRQIARKKGVDTDNIGLTPTIAAGYVSDDDLWVTVLAINPTDQRVCKICQPLHLRRRSVWEPKFPLGTPAHHRCRCWIQYKQQRFLRVPQGA